MKEPRLTNRAGSREESIRPGTSPEPAPAQAVLEDPSGLTDISSRRPGVGNTSVSWRGQARPGAPRRHVAMVMTPIPMERD